MPRALRLLTTDRAPAYLRSLAALDARLDVLVADGDGLDGWWARLRELPDSVRAIRPAIASERLTRGVYDAVIAHSPSDALALGGSAPTILVLHERRELAEAFGDTIADWDHQTRAAVGQARVVYSSPESARSWPVDGPTIPLVVDAAEWPLGDLMRAEAVTVTPFAVERAAFDTAYLLAQVLARVPVAVLGLNPGLGIEQDTAIRPCRQRAFAHMRAYLNLSSPAFETAAPSAMLEAMAAGLPVVTLAHPDSPVVDGVNGFVATGPEELAACVRELLADQALALRLGSAARATVLGRARVTAFRETWADLLGEVTARPIRRVA